MTRTLLLLRHGKSDWSHGSGPDEQRPVARRGRSAAKAIGRFIAESGLIPDVAVTSPAVRARDTLHFAADAGGWPCLLREDDALYGAVPSEVIALVRAEPDTTGRLLLVGHEPCWSELIATLIGGGSHRMPTAAVAGIDLDVASWAQLQPGAGRLLFLLPPRLLTG